VAAVAGRLCGGGLGCPWWLRGRRVGLCHLPVLAMTADVIQATYEECIKSGMDGYVSKPFDEEQL
jgi:CheY-like chemotaxis protein